MSLSILFLCILGNLVDFISTYIAIRYLGLMEANPYVRNLIAKSGGWVEWWIIKNLCNLILIGGYVLAMSIPRKFDMSQLSGMELRIINIGMKLIDWGLIVLAIYLWLIAMINVFNILAEIL